MIRNKEGYLHSTTEPALVEKNKSVWYENGMIHRIGGPAYIADEKNCEWWVHGELHRTDGPAIISEACGNHWYIHGNKLTEVEHAMYVFVNGGSNERGS